MVTRSTSPTSRRRGQARGVRSRDALIAAGRRLFVEHGYFDTSTAQIVAEAGVGTRGVLYHHFEAKQDLFLAVFETIEHDFINATAAALEHVDDPLELLEEGLCVLLAMSASDSEFQRVILVDGPAVLGWERWREAGAAGGLSMIADRLEAAIEAGAIAQQPSSPLSNLLLAASEEAALYVANHSDRETALRDATLSLRNLLRGLRSN